jgi:hypothetical protein
MRGRAEFLGDDTIKSISLADMLPPNAPPRRPFTAGFPFFARMVNPVNIALMASGAFWLGAFAGMSAFYLVGAVDPLGPATVSAPASTNASAPPAAECLAALIDAALPPTMTAASLSREAATAPNVPRADLAPTPATAAPALAPNPTMIVQARLPRPRPEDPIITGSIAPAASKLPRTPAKSGKL